MRLGFKVLLFWFLIVGQAGFGAAVSVDALWSGLFDNNGQPLAAGLVYTYTAGTTASKTTWLDSAKTTPAANPVVLDAYGRAAIYADGNYKFVIKDSGGVTLATIDNLEYISTVSPTTLAATNLTVTNGTINSLTSTHSVLSDSTISSAVITLSTISNPTVTNGSFSATVLWNPTISNPTISSGSWTAATIYSGNATFTNAVVTNATVTNLIGTTATIHGGNATFTNLVTTNHTTTNSTVSSGTFTNAVIHGGNATFTNLVAANVATPTSATQPANKGYVDANTSVTSSLLDVPLEYSITGYGDNSRPYTSITTSGVWYTCASVSISTASGEQDIVFLNGVFNIASATYTGPYAYASISFLRTRLYDISLGVGAECLPTQIYLYNSGLSSSSTTVSQLIPFTVVGFAGYTQPATYSVQVYADTFAGNMNMSVMFPGFNRAKFKRLD